MKNPFELLGLSPEIVRSLEGRELFALIKASYRALLMIYHPDRAPLQDELLKLQKTRKVAELNLAYEKLDLERNPDSLEHYRDLYVKRRGDGWQKTVRRLKQDLQDLTLFNQTLSRNYLRHLLSPFSPGGPASATETALPALRNLRIGLQDVAINYNVRSSSWNLGTNYKEIKMDQEGRMSYRLPSRKRFIPINFITLLGTVGKEQVDLIPLLDRVVPKDCQWPPPKWKKSFPEYLKCFDLMNSLSLDDFRSHCLPFLKPDLVEGSFLFSFHKTIPQPGRINLEGLIIRLNPAKSPKAAPAH
ncbi:MAG: J domain-containing protein [Deltaproteobacteria bacterium]|nr:J domain-containing protein [Deltaproteobacteria bacterium]